MCGIDFFIDIVYYIANTHQMSPNGGFLFKTNMSIKQCFFKGLAAAIIVQSIWMPASTVIAEQGASMSPHIEDAIAHSSIEHIGSMKGTRRGIPAVITGYSSTPDQTDDSPFITASGALVGDGVIAANFLPFGTKVQIPKLFGNKVFIVKDRMHRRFNDRVDIWFNDRMSAIKFGLRNAEIMVL